MRYVRSIDNFISANRTGEMEDGLPVPDFIEGSRFTGRLFRGGGGTPQAADDPRIRPGRGAR